MRYGIDMSFRDICKSYMYMRKPALSLLTRSLYLFVLFITIAVSGISQIRIASWIGYNSKTDHFPLSAASYLPAAVDDAFMNYNDLKPLNGHSSAWTSET